MSFTSGLHGPRVCLTIPKTFDDFEVISVIGFAQDNLESNSLLTSTHKPVLARAPSSLLNKTILILSRNLKSLKSQVVLLQTAHSWANAGVLLGGRMHRERGSFRYN